MTKTLFAATAVIALMAAMPATAGEWYAQVNAGAVVAGEIDADITDGEDTLSGSVDLETGFAVGAAGGVDLGNNFRVELEGLYSETELDDEGFGLDTVEVQNASAFVNVLYDIPMEGGFTPYVGAGFGYGSTTLTVDNESVHDQGTVWQIRAGASYPVNDTLTLDFGYRYMDQAEFGESISDGDTTLTMTLEPNTHAVTVGARFKLGATAE